jgi:hypothetical protein
MCIGLLREDEGKVISVLKALCHNDMGMKVQLQIFLTSVDQFQLEGNGQLQAPAASSMCQLSTRLGRPYTWSGHSRKKKNVSLLGMELRFSNITHFND